MRGERESEVGERNIAWLFCFLTDYTEVIVLHMSRNLNVALDFVEGVWLFFAQRQLY